MIVNWEMFRGPSGNFSWMYRVLNTQWTAGVHDIGSSIAPIPPTTYRISAGSPTQHTEGKQTFTDFAEAKREAINLLLQQMEK